MPDSDWTGYVGMVTGIFGAVMGYLGYRRANQIKKLDLRLELRKGLSEAHTALAEARRIMDYAAQSHRAALAARALGGSGVMVAWNNSHEEDTAAVDRIAASIRGESAGYDSLSEEQLESEIVANHKLSVRLNVLIAKYRDEIAADDDARRLIAQFYVGAAASGNK